MLLLFAAIAIFSVANPPLTFHVAKEWAHYGEIRQKWVSLSDTPLHLQRALVAAEDANFCRHWGFDIESIERSILAGTSYKGASITQKVARTVFLWPEESRLRRVLETPITLVIEVLWSKQRILEVFVNATQFDRQVFGVAEAARRYFGVELKELNELESATLAAIVPAPVELDAKNPSKETLDRAKTILDGSHTIAEDGRDDCFTSAS